jgi:tRNA threonylcarbamoyladenosine biosynthesis protein TsaB
MDNNIMRVFSTKVIYLLKEGGMCGLFCTFTTRMALILHIETSTSVCSVAVSLDGDVLFSQTDRNGPSHATLIGPYLDKALTVVEETGRKLDAVAVSAGPGSYTGLRIGASAAKGVCYALSVPLIAVSTLELMAYTCRTSGNWTDYTACCPVLDARRMEVYTALYDSEGTCLEEPHAQVVEAHSFHDAMAANRVVFAGNGAAKLKTVIEHEQAGFDETVEPLAENMVTLAEKSYKEGTFVDVAYFEPNYIKEFVATVKKNLIPEKK